MSAHTYIFITSATKVENQSAIRTAVVLGLIYMHTCICIFMYVCTRGFALSFQCASAATVAATITNSNQFRCKGKRNCGESWLLSHSFLLCLRRTKSNLQIVAAIVFIVIAVVTAAACALVCSV